MKLETKEWKQVKTVYLAGRVDEKEDRVDYIGKIPEAIIHNPHNKVNKMISKWRLDFLQEWARQNSFSQITWAMPELEILDSFPNTQCIECYADKVLFFINDYKKDINTLIEIAYAKGLGKTTCGIFNCAQTNETIKERVSIDIISTKVVFFTDNWLQLLLAVARPFLIESPIEFELWRNIRHLIPQVAIVTDLPLYGCEARSIFTRADFMIPDSKIVIYCDGYEFHNEKEAFKRDRIIDKILIANGYLSVRFSGSEIYQDACGCAAYLKMLSEKNFNRSEEDISITL